MTDEDKVAVKQAYLDSNPTAANSAEIVAKLATEYEATVNSIRMFLTKAGVYIKVEKAPAGATAAKRTSKADAIAELTAAITAADQPVESDIVDKLTGKAALYFAGVIRAATPTSD